MLMFPLAPSVVPLMAPALNGPVVAKAPVLGLKVSLVLVTLMGRLPVAAVTQVGYMVALVVVSSVMVGETVPVIETGIGLVVETGVAPTLSESSRKIGMIVLG